MGANKAIERDWSSLPPEVLNLFAKRLSDISDFVRFRAVCTTWCSSTKITDFPPQFPWIVEKRRFPHDSEYLHFYSVPLGKMYTIHAPKFFGKLIFWPSNGYILVELCSSKGSFGQLTIHEALINPLNNHEIPVPAYNFGNCGDSVGPFQNQMGVHMVCPGHQSDQKPKLLSYHLGQDSWCELTLASTSRFRDIFYLNSMVFIIDCDTGCTNVIDITTDTLAYVIAPIEGYLPKNETFILDASGDVLRVFRHYGPSEDLYWFDVYRLNLSRSSSAHWVKVNSIGNQALFIDYDDCFALEASDFVGIKRNCIYSLMKFYQGTQKELLFRFERIDIETGAREHVPCPFKEPDSWFVPSLQRLCAD